jgi:two-component system nitrate/nitrite response regulator NarL
MTMQHLFLSSNARAPGPRWLETFAQGTTVSPTALPGQLAKRSASDCIIWVTCEDARWKGMLELAKKTLPNARVVVLSSTQDPAEGLAALDAGAMGYTHSYALPEVLTEVATVVEHGGLWAGPDLIRRLIASTTAALARLPVSPNGPGTAAKNYTKAWATLSAREAQVAACVAEGLSNLEVATKLFISERTVKAHVGAAFEKLGVRDRLQLAVAVSAIDPATRAAKGVTT